MRIFKLISIITLFLAFFSLLSTYSKGDEACNCTPVDGLIRVGISTNDFQRLEYGEASLSSAGKLELFDKFEDKKIKETSAGDVLKFVIEKTTFEIYKNGELIASNIMGPILVQPLDENPIQVVGLKRVGKQAAYRGVFEVVRAPGKEGKFSLVNIIPLEDYLKGVVPNELAPHFGMEALKAQTIAARNYAIKPRVRFYKQFDVCDSVQSQVYFGYNTEKPETNEAIEATKGLVAMYEGDVILALYSSTAGGYTENYENAFSEQGGGSFPAKPLSYLKGKPDNREFPVLNTEAKAREFYLSCPASYDVNSGYYRWTREWTGEELRNVLNTTLPAYSTSSLVSPTLKKGEDIGRIKRIDVISRGVSGKIIAMAVKTSKGEWIIKKELVIRRVLKKSGKALPSANIVFNNLTGKDGYLVKLEAFGGGFGHGVGMSQYGASYMSKNGFTFDQILQHYYDGIAIGTWPVYLHSDYNAQPVKQEFASPNGKADLLIDNTEGIGKFEFIINSKKISLNNDQLRHSKIRIPLDRFIKKGVNEIMYLPPDENEEKSVRVWVEVFRKAENK
ncbi:MAG: SpoIID/LytB domain-containing protein [Candidatus Gastranaerophilales bacterium]|nr:SpoIID/LytB domain-containing protein [Candidatus Gastranaerophilales bacterium]